MTLAPPSTAPLRRLLMALAVGVLLVTMVPPATGAPAAGSAGTDTSLPATDSKVTVNGRGGFAGLEMTVNQTRNLGNQAISVTWKGGTPTAGQFDSDYLQIMQCWGDDDGTIPGNPGPPPEQCVFGGTNSSGDDPYGVVFPSTSSRGALVLQRTVSSSGWGPKFDPSDGFVERGVVHKPFRAVGGTVVNVMTNPDFNSNIGGEYWLNTFFNAITTNEIPGGRTRANGSGAELFEVNTGVESSGLGCGQAVQPVAGGPAKVPRCWLVIVPRGNPADENVDSLPGETLAVIPSPLAARPWRNRIAIPLEFNPVNSPCSLSDDQRRLGGSELALPAVVSWQPKLCAIPGLPPYAYGISGDAAARQQVLSGAPGAPGMVVVTRPIDPSTLPAGKPVTYAPISLSGLVIGFNIERVPRANPEPPPDVKALGGARVAQINLTPRLVAKLLTQSYRSQVSIFAASPYEWAKDNPPYLGVDPDFRQFNPEFELLSNSGKNFGGLVMSSLNADAPHLVWEWVLADPEARAWLDGAPDQWGMDVNPVYATKAAANSAGVAFADPIPTSFPKGDPFCYKGPPQGVSGRLDVVPPPLCGNDWLPYAQGMREAARATRAADDGAKTENFADAQRPEQVWKRNQPQTLGSRTFLSITDSASASQYGVQMARLSRAGDNGPDRTFIAPDAAGLAAGAAAMAPKAEPAVLEPAPTAAAPSAYPLTALTYAAIAPLSLDDKARQEYAAFVDYASGAGQVAGLELGQLPPGYAPLPESLKAQARDAAKTIRELAPAAGAANAGPAAAASTAPAGSAAANQSSSSGSSTAGRGSTATAAPVSIPVVSAPATEPSSPLATALTPVLALARSRFVLVGLIAIALLSALGALEITKRPQRGPGGRALAGAEVPTGYEAGVQRRRKP